MPISLNGDGIVSGVTTFTTPLTGVTTFSSVDATSVVVGSAVTINSSGIEVTGITTISSTLDLSQSTTGIALPQGTTAQRPSGNSQYLRWNTSNSALEFYNGTDWVEIISDYFPSGSTTLG